MEAPDFTVMMANIAKVFPSLYVMLGALVMLMAFMTAFSGVMDLVQGGDRGGKVFGAESGGFMSGIIKLCLAALLANLAYSGQLLSWVSHGLFGTTQYDLVSLDSYVPDQNNTELRESIKFVAVSLTQFVGIIAVVKGIRVWIRAADKTGRESVWTGLSFIIAGVLCVQVTLVAKVVENTLGYAFLTLFGVLG